MYRTTYRIVKTPITVDLDALRAAYEQGTKLVAHWGQAANTETANGLDYFSVKVSQLHSSRFQGQGYGGAHKELEYYEVDDIGDRAVRNERCVGYLNNLLDFFEEGFRGTFWTLSPGMGIKLHVDEPSEVFAAHVALYTNPLCREGYEDGDLYHIEADGHVYLMTTNIKHCAFNHGNESRTHCSIRLPLSTWDRYSAMKHHIES